MVGVFTVPDKDGKADPLGECQLGGGWIEWSTDRFCYCSGVMGAGNCHRNASERWSFERL